MSQIIFICYHCQGYNKHQRDAKEFEEKDTEFRSFSSAWEHMFNNREHWMDARIELDDEE